MAMVKHFHAHETARMDALSGLPLASFWQRAMAIAIDGLLILLVQLLFGHNLHHGGKSAGPWTMAGLLVDVAERVSELLESALYFAVLLKLGKGQTPGKWIMHCRVASLLHDEVSWWTSIERALGYGASLLEGGFGFVQFFFMRNRQCVHDRIAETVVLDVRPKATRLADETLEKE